MAVILNQLGEDYVDFLESTVTKRVGRRIRAIRMEKGLSQSELAELVDLEADKIQKCENGRRKAKIGLLKKMSSALNVNTLAFLDPYPASYMSTMFVFFELENKYNFKPEMIDGKLVLSLDNDSIVLSDYLLKWYKKIDDKNTKLSSASTEEEKADIEKDYRIWKYTFPESIALNIGDSAKKNKLLEEIEQHKEQLEQLKEQLKKLDEDE